MFTDGYYTDYRSLPAEGLRTVLLIEQFSIISVIFADWLINFWILDYKVVSFSIKESGSDKNSTVEYRFEKNVRTLTRYYAS